MLCDWHISWMMVLVSFLSYGFLSSNGISEVNGCDLRPPPCSATVYVGQTKYFTCGVYSSNVRFTWKYQRQLGSHLPTYTVQGQQSCDLDSYCFCEIKLTNITLNQRGYYTCVATCSNGQSVSTSAYLRVLGPPQFVNHPVSRNVSRGENVAVSSEIESDPAANITWFVRYGKQSKDDVHVLKSSGSSTGVGNITSRTTLLKGVTTSAQIFCSANNSFGTVNSTVAFINIKEPPEAVIVVTAYAVTATSLTLTWTPGFDGYSSILATYIKWHPASVAENVSVANTTNLAQDGYVISDLQPATLYDIWVAVSNDQGVSDWSTPLRQKTQHTAPPAPKEVTAECFNNKVNISWTRIPYGREHGEIMHYVVTVVGLSNYQTTKTRSFTNDILVHNSHTTLSFYNITVYGVTDGGEGLMRGITFQCFPAHKSEGEDQDKPKMSTNKTLTLYSNANFSTMPSVTRDASTTTEKTVLTTKVLSATSILPSTGVLPATGVLPFISQQQHRQQGYQNYILFIPASVLAVLLLGILVGLAYSHHVKIRHRDKLQRTQSQSCIEMSNQRHTTRNYLQEQSQDPDDLVQTQLQQDNLYQTHIVSLVNADQCQRGQVNWEEIKYENSVAHYAQQINLDEKSRQQFYEALIPIQQVTTGVIIGEGEFGWVCSGYLNYGANKRVKIAIKRMKDITDIKAYETFIKEGIITKGFDHRNVLAIIGVSLDEDISGHLVPVVLMPYMENGDLRTYLYNARVVRGIKISVYQLVSYMLDIAAGMEYLANRKFVHRDLAARNCMLDRDFSVKIADFGLTRNVCGADYYRISQDGKSCKIPVKWVAIESLRDGKFTTNSDVWACGVTMWEIISQAQIPYPGVSNCSLYQHLVEGYRLKQPEGCPDQLYHILSSCWKADERRRPNFLTLKESLLELLFEWKKVDLDVDMELNAMHCLL